MMNFTGSFLAYVAVCVLFGAWISVRNLEVDRHGSTWGQFGMTSLFWVLTFTVGYIQGAFDGLSR